MRLIECHIENFGGLHDRRIAFQPGFHVICEENGWGKSALAAFIRVMFYGFGGERKREITENERKYYMPWQGGAYGGTLTFETGGKRYTAARSFGAKETQDTFELRDADTNRISKDFSANLGSELFGIDRESFLRTVFIGQNQAETSATDDIHARVSGITDEAFDMNNYQKAQERLTAAANRLTPRRSTGSVYKKKELAASLKRSVSDGAGTESSVQEYCRMLAAQRKEYERCVLLREEIQKGQEEAVQFQSALAKKDEWMRLKSDAGIREEKRRAARAEFPKGVPTLQEVDECLEQCGELEKAKERERISALSPSETLQFQECERLFRDQVPELKTLDERIGDARRLEQMKQQLAGEQLSLSEQERLRELEVLFQEDRETVSSLLALWNNRSSRKAALPSSRASLSMLGRTLEQEQKRGRTEIPLWILGGALLLGAVVLFFVFGSLGLLYSAVSGAAGALCLAAGFLTYRKNRRAAGKPSGEYQDLERQIREDEAYVQSAEKKVSAYLSAHGREYAEETAADALQELSGEYVEYLGLQKRDKRARESGLPEEMESVRTRLSLFLKTFGIYGEEGGFSQELFQLKNQADAYGRLKKKRESALQGQRGAKALQERLEDFFQKYGLRYETEEGGMRRRLTEIRDAVNGLQAAEEAAERARRELERFEAETDMSVLQKEIPENAPSLEEWNQKNLENTEKMDKIQETIRNYLNVLEEKQEELERLEEEKEKLQETEEELRRETQMFSDVQKAREYLERARDAITNRYTSALMKVFRDSYQDIAGRSADAFHMDADTKMTVDGGGMQRAVESLSAGYRDLVGICLRISLIGAMYEQEKPMLVMDDPFVNMDDEKVRDGLKYLEKISSKYQVIYFTCSDVRAGGRKEWQEN